MLTFFFLQALAVDADVFAIIFSSLCCFSFFPFCTTFISEKYAAQAVLAHLTILSWRLHLFLEVDELDLGFYWLGGAPFSPRQQQPGLAHTYTSVCSGWWLWTQTLALSWILILLFCALKMRGYACTVVVCVLTLNSQLTIYAAVDGELNATVSKNSTSNSTAEAADNDKLLCISLCNGIVWDHRYFCFCGYFSSFHSVFFVCVHVCMCVSLVKIMISEVIFLDYTGQDQRLLKTKRKEQREIANSLMALDDFTKQYKVVLKLATKMIEVNYHQFRYSRITTQSCHWSFSVPAAHCNWALSSIAANLDMLLSLLSHWSLSNVSDQWISTSLQYSWELREDYFFFEHDTEANLETHL